MTVQTHRLKRIQENTDKMQTTKYACFVYKGILKKNFHVLLPSSLHRNEAYWPCGREQPQSNAANQEAGNCSRWLHLALAGTAECQAYALKSY